mmetsp:Transcript_24818/g.36409  ORF Transcript_24818/g.36409 Transcript_24818/m.36409 type:complete len:466 (-) Transcript_24818:50-1447(-)|eukprot:CAMPEP_0195528048 /NCGR_PEP_ID=MMETSP0794_2-20130614/30026_1 /TAXON_ID=515487 /ORGANISM="Stephanopyxis turris, Strain CCMP 815" /LENGTH=465 /DNA_ID=CAMNT_0040659095 /DNA_START=76 /DNA_END=1473 /DNA_ORIENTATION=-
MTSCPTNKPPRRSMDYLPVSASNETAEVADRNKQLKTSSGPIHQKPNWEGQQNCFEPPRGNFGGGIPVSGSEFVPHPLAGNGTSEPQQWNNLSFGNNNINSDDQHPHAPISSGCNNNSNNSSEKESSKGDGGNNDSDNKKKTSKDYYFDSYSHHGIHEEMLKDEVRTRTYQLAILNNAHLFEDKVVLDVGCGTGILSMFAAQAGARHVYAVDCSSIIQQATQIVEKNGFGDKITLIKGKMEEIQLPVEKVDIIISEWMGYFLLYESMLDTVLFARDKFLVENGIIFPDKAVMYLCGIEDAPIKEERIDFWDNVYGFDMSCIKEIALSEPVVDIVDSKNVCTEAVPILKLDLLTCTTKDLAFSSDFAITAKRNDYVHGLVAYFECAFTQVHKPLGWSTSPFSKYTHWKQTTFYLRDTVVICKDEQICGNISCRPNDKNPRDLDIQIKVQFAGIHSKLETTLDYRLR